MNNELNKKLAEVRTVNRYFNHAHTNPALALCLAIEKLIDEK